MNRLPRLLTPIRRYASDAVIREPVARVTAEEQAHLHHAVCEFSLLSAPRRKDGD